MNRWQIHGAILLRRLPELMPQMNLIESRVQDIFNLYEVAKSKLSDHEMKHLEETALKEKEDSEVMIKETAQDREDQWIKEKSKFQFAEYNDRLSYTQYMFFKQKFGKTDDKERWLVPQTTYNSELDTTLLDTARRALKEHLNITTGYRVVSKIPSSCYSFLYPKKLIETIGYRGAKVFFIKAILDNNPNASVLEAIDETKNNNIRWLTIKESEDLVRKNYLRGIVKGLLHENRVDCDEVLRRASNYSNAIMAKSRQQENKLHRQQQ